MGICKPKNLNINSPISLRGKDQGGSPHFLIYASTFTRAQEPWLFRLQVFLAAPPPCLQLMLNKISISGKGITSQPPMRAWPAVLKWL